LAAAGADLATAGLAAVDCAHANGVNRHVASAAACSSCSGVIFLPMVPPDDLGLIALSVRVGIANPLTAVKAVDAGGYLVEGI
jgi:hypothetical protein